MNDNVSRLEDAPHVPVVNVPNALTVMRLVLVPVFVWLMLLEGAPARWWALGVFCVAAATDQLDGHIARAQGLITDFGKIADPIADKALTLSAFVMLSIDGLLPWWFTVIVAARELGVTWLRAVLLRRGVVVAANMAGKLKTVLQMLLIVLMLVPWPTSPNATVLWPLNAPAPVLAVQIAQLVVGVAALIATIWSGVAYVVEGVKLGRGSDAS